MPWASTASSLLCTGESVRLILGLLIVLACEPALHDDEILEEITPSDTATDSGSSDDEATLEPWIEALSVTESEHVSTILELDWTLSEALDTVWVEFRVTGEEWRSSRAQPGGSGPHTDLLLGLPGSTDVDFRLVGTREEQTLYGQVHQTRTGLIPLKLARPELDRLDASLTHDADFMLGSVDMGSSWYSGPWWLFIMDRQARIVWYYEIPDGNCSMFPRVSYDGTHVLFDRTSSYSHYDSGATSSLWRMTLDQAWSQSLEIPGMAYTYSETAEGSIIHDNVLGTGSVDVMEIWPDGTTETLWSCSNDIYGYCGSNTTNWIESSDTVLFSMYWAATVVELDRKTGAVVAQYGQAEGSYEFDDPSHGFEMQHFPGYTSDGTLLVHTHMPTEPDQQRAYEYEIDHENRRLELIWEFGEGYPEYATYSGEAVRLDNGNTLINYGTEGEIREVTPDGQVAWEAAFPSHYLIGHTELIEDLYDLVEGPRER
jgi:hypothetical protein